MLSGFLSRLDNSVETVLKLTQIDSRKEMRFEDEVEFSLMQFLW